MFKIQLALIVLIIFIVNSSLAQVATNSPLYLDLKETDSLLFEGVFNNCDFTILEYLIAEDFEFYHDENGIQYREGFIQSLRESICSDPNFKPIRKLEESSLEVFRMKNEGDTYGAIQKGIHYFYIKEPNKKMYLTNIAKFTHLWIEDKGQWKLSRILSFDHQEPKKEYGIMFNANFPKPLFDNEKQIEKLLEQHHIPSMAMGYVENGRISQLKAFGVQKDSIPVSVNTIYKVASLTKPIAALIALKLVDQGLLDLDELLSNYHIDSDIKGHPYTKKLTARIVLSHQSGFPNWRYLNESNVLDFDFEPGTKFQYSGEGFEYLRLAIEKKLGQPFEQIADEILFTPLGMTDTHFYWSSALDEERYAVEHDEYGEVVEFEKHKTSSAAANLMTTSNDYSKFLVHIMEGAGLADGLYTEFLAVQVNEKSGIDRNLGMQLLRNLPNNEFALMHTGGDYGIKTIAIALPNSKRGLVLFFNSENGMVLWQKIISEYFADVGEEIVRRNLE